jgi:P pilus assembly chaperone PapD
MKLLKKTIASLFFFSLSPLLSSATDYTISPYYFVTYPGSRVVFNVSNLRKDLPILVRIRVEQDGQKICKYLRVIPRILFIPPHKTQKTVIFVPDVSLPKGEYRCYIVFTEKVYRPSVGAGNNQVTEGVSAGVTINLRYRLPVYIRSGLTPEDLKLAVSYEVKDHTLILHFKKAGLAHFRGWFHLFLYKDGKKVYHYEQDLVVLDQRTVKRELPKDLKSGKYTMEIYAVEMPDLQAQLWKKGKTILKTEIEIK